MTISQTSDKEYIASVLSRPGMVSLCLGGLQKEYSIQDVLNQEGHVFFRVDDNGDMGFVSLTDVGEGRAVIHLALRTRGAKTLHCVLEVLKQASSFGFREVLAIYPETRRSVRRIAEIIGFKTLSEHIPVSGFSDMFISQSIKI